MCELLCDLNWSAIALCVIAGQMASTLWFVVLFGDQWAKEYGAPSRQEHTKQIPLQTYLMGATCTLLIVLGVAALQKILMINNLIDGLKLGVFLVLCFCLPSVLPGQAFLKRWNVFLLSCGSQSLIILLSSIILSVWR